METDKRIGRYVVPYFRKVQAIVIVVHRLRFVDVHKAILSVDVMTIHGNRVVQNVPLTGLTEENSVLWKIKNSHLKL